MTTDPFLGMLEHSGKLFKLLMEVTSDERISVDIRLEYLAKIKQAVEKAQTENTPPMNPRYTSFIHPQGRAES